MDQCRNKNVRNTNAENHTFSPKLYIFVIFYDLQQNWKRFYNALGFAGYAKKKLFGFRKSARTPHCGMSIRKSI